MSLALSVVPYCFISQLEYHRKSNLLAQMIMDYHPNSNVMKYFEKSSEITYVHPHPPH